MQSTRYFEDHQAVTSASQWELRHRLVQSYFQASPTLAAEHGPQTNASIFHLDSSTVQHPRTQLIIDHTQTAIPFLFGGYIIEMYLVPPPLDSNRSDPRIIYRRAGSGALISISTILLFAMLIVEIFIFVFRMDNFILSIWFPGRPVNLLVSAFSSPFVGARIRPTISCCWITFVASLCLCYFVIGGHTSLTKRPRPSEAPNHNASYLMSTPRIEISVGISSVRGDYDVIVW